MGRPQLYFLCHCQCSKVRRGKFPPVRFILELPTTKDSSLFRLLINFRLTFFYHLLFVIISSNVLAKSMDISTTLRENNKEKLQGGDINRLMSALEGISK